VRSVPALLVACLLLAGCGSSRQIDVTAWQEELSSQGRTPGDFATYQQTFADLCNSAPDQLTRFLTSASAPGSQEMHTGFKYACPGEMDKLDDAYAPIVGSTASVERACNARPSDRTEEQRQLAAAVGC